MFTTLDDQPQSLVVVQLGRLLLVALAKHSAQVPHRTLITLLANILDYIAPASRIADQGLRLRQCSATTTPAAAVLPAVRCCIALPQKLGQMQQCMVWLYCAIYGTACYTHCSDWGAYGIVMSVNHTRAVAYVNCYLPSRKDRLYEPTRHVAARKAKGSA